MPPGAFLVQGLNETRSVESLHGVLNLYCFGFRISAFMKTHETTFCSCPRIGSARE